MKTNWNGETNSTENTSFLASSRGLKRELSNFMQSTRLSRFSRNDCVISRNFLINSETFNKSLYSPKNSKLIKNYEKLYNEVFSKNNSSNNKVSSLKDFNNKDDTFYKKLYKVRVECLTNNKINEPQVKKARCSSLMDSMPKSKQSEKLKSKIEEFYQIKNYQEPDPVKFKVKDFFGQNPDRSSFSQKKRELSKLINNESSASLFVRDNFVNCSKNKGLSREKSLKITTSIPKEMFSKMKNKYPDLISDFKINTGQELLFDCGYKNKLNKMKSRVDKFLSSSPVTNRSIKFY
jgi:hypothetical protein